MKLTIYTTKNEYNTIDSFELSMNDKYQFRIGNGICPEDATLNRDLNFVFNIPKLIKQAYQAGKNGEEFIEEWIDIKEED